MFLQTAVVAPRGSGETQSFQIMTHIILSEFIWPLWVSSPIPHCLPLCVKTLHIFTSDCFLIVCENLNLWNTKSSPYGTSSHFTFKVIHAPRSAYDHFSCNLCWKAVYLMRGSVSVNRRKYLPGLSALPITFPPQKMYLLLNEMEGETSKLQNKKKTKTTALSPQIAKETWQKAQLEDQLEVHQCLSFTSPQSPRDTHQNFLLRQRELCSFIVLFAFALSFCRSR